MVRLTAEIAAVESVAEGTTAKSVLTSQVDATAQRYSEMRQREDSFKRDAVGVGLGVVLSLGGIGLGTWAALHGGAYLWWWALAVPAIILGVPGFFHEVTGGDSKKASTDGTSSPGPGPATS